MLTLGTNSQYKHKNAMNFLIDKLLVLKIMKHFPIYQYFIILFKHLF